MPAFGMRPEVQLARSFVCLLGIAFLQGSAAIFFRGSSYAASHSSAASSKSYHTASYGSPSVFLTVSSLRNRRRPQEDARNLELNWFNSPSGMDEDRTSWVGLFDQDPAIDGLGKPLFQVPTRDFTKSKEPGYYRTNISFPRLEFDANELSTSKCLGYWIAYVNSNRLVASSCLMAHPTWMYDMRHVIGNRTLPDLMIPGTHNSGSYEKTVPERTSMTTRYQMCQEESLFNQLVYGIRYLDLRLSYRRVASRPDEVFWISHGLLRSDVGMNEAIAQVKKFLQATNEIVIMDFHLFGSGFTGREGEERHKTLIGLLESELGEFLIPRSYGYHVTLNTLWNSGKRLFVGYATENHKKSKLLFPRVRHLWGEQDTLSGLEQYFNTNMCLYRADHLWSAMAELTPQSMGVVFDRYGGLRVMADQVNRHVTAWFRDRWWHCANIVATDFFLGNNMIEVSIISNRKRWQ